MATNGENLLKIPKFSCDIPNFCIFVNCLKRQIKQIKYYYEETFFNDLILCGAAVYHAGSDA